ncbi:hypothetical protein C8Q73DRAFT_667430 [Cubamyces lactineus]|nr:hypothetical protein C8Q73DRAFT_667430 [Cubamyces lactineus]
MSNFKIPGQAFPAVRPVERNFNAQHVARPADSPKKRLSTREVGAKPAVAAATSASPYKRDAVREAGQKALQSVAAAQKRVQKTLRPNLAGLRVNVPDPAGLQSPSALYPSGELPITVKQMQDVVEDVRGRYPKEHLDQLVGEYIASLLPPLNVKTTPLCLASMDAVRDLCNAPWNNVVRQPAKSPHHPMRFKRGGRAVTSFQHPVVFMDELQALSINNVASGNHGYAYMGSSDCAGLHEMGPFHLFNRPVYGNSSPTKGGEVVNIRWHYCGVYVAHKTPIFLSEEGWRRVPDETKRKIAETFCHIMAYNDKHSLRDCTPDAVDVFLRDLNRGNFKLPLMVFRCVGFPIDYVTALGRSDVQQSFALGRVPEKRQIDYNAIQETRPVAGGAQESVQHPVDTEAQKRESAQERARRQAQEAEWRARDEEDQRRRNQMVRQHRMLGPHRGAPAPGPQ